MSKIELPSIANPSNVSLMNSNFKKIEDALNEEVLYRRGYTGEPNEMNTNLDMNGRRILNVAVGPDSGDLATKGYVDQGLSLKYDKTGGPLSGDVQMQGHHIFGLPNATQLSEPATYGQLLQAESGEDSLLRSDLAAPSGSSIVGFKQAALAAVPSTVQGKLRESVSVKDFGAVGDGLTNDAAAIQAAMDYVSSVGGGIVSVPTGKYAVTTRLRPVSNVTLRGTGAIASQFVIPAGVSNKNAIIYNTDIAFPTSNFIIENLGFVGQWQAFQSEISDNGLVTVKFATNMIIRHCGFFYSRGFVLNINECDEVTVEGNLFEHAPRDMIAVWGTPNVRVINNILRHNDDDGISVSLVAPAVVPIKSKAIITGNILEDTGPIRTQATKNAVISNNVISRAKGQGIRVGVYASSTSSVSSNHGVLITNNVITDVIDRQWFVDGTQTGSVNNRIYIDVQSNPTYAGTLPVAPGEIDPSTGLVQSPYDYYYKVSDIGISGPMRAPNGVKVSGNICKRTLPAVAVYSDWGYGQAYTKNGSVNYQVPDVILRSIGMRVAVPFTNLIVDGNHIEVGRHGIMFILDSSATLSSRIAKNIHIINNHILDTDNFGIFWNIATMSHQDITISGNTLDCDPNFISANRTAGGGWTSGPVSPTAFKLDQLGSISLFRNNVRNCLFVISQSGVSATQYIEGNILYADAASTGFSASNKGVGNIPPIGGGEQWWLQYEDSDPTSATYKQSLGANLKNTLGMPTSGKYLVGMIVMARPSAPIGTAGSQYVVIGHLRRTTGTSHVLDTDWTELRCLTGT